MFIALMKKFRLKIFNMIFGIFQKKSSHAVSQIHENLDGTLQNSTTIISFL